MNQNSDDSNTNTNSNTNSNTNNSEFLYVSPIGLGNASSRPLGTPYEKTSYAYVHKNVIFVTVDAFHNNGSGLFDKEQGIGGTGIVTCTVVGDHLAWFEEVLKEASEDPAIEHIFVQAHIPILQPVRKINSSGQYFDHGTDSDFWKLMQKYEVDIYFGGEVHSNTATKDAQSNLLQVISRGNRLNNFLKVEVKSKELLTISALNEIGTKWRWNGEYEPHGELVIRKGTNSTEFESSGALELLDTSAGPLISLQFGLDNIFHLEDRQVVGLKYDQFQTTLTGHSITIRGETSSEGIKNLGVFGCKFFTLLVLLYVPMFCCSFFNHHHHHHHIFTNSFNCFFPSLKSLKRFFICCSTIRCSNCKH